MNLLSTLNSLSNVCLLYFFRSEIHEKMRCSRCRIIDEPQSSDVLSTIVNSESDEETSDIGGFAEIAGCLENLKGSEKQVAFEYCWI